MSERIRMNHAKYIRKAKRLVEETKLERAVKIFGEKNGRILNAVHDLGQGGIGTFSERLDMAYEIIKLNTKK